VIADDVPACAAAAAVLSGALLLADAREQVEPDEGYLWYGTLRTLDGQVPLRDFRSYEPGRYYWSALWMLVLGRGVLALRVAQHGFYFLGLSCGLLALRLGGVEWPAVIAAGITLTAWAYPNYKLFEPALAMAAVLAGTILLESPDTATAAAAGVTAGATAFFGVNYSLYSGTALLGLTLLAGAKSGTIGVLAGLGAYFTGFIIGLLPLLILGAIARGMLSAMFERRVRQVLARGTTNLPLPVPWPWRPNWRRPVARWFIGIYFLLLPAFTWSVAIWAALAPWGNLRAQGVLVAAAFVGAAAVHHAFSRADLIHLAQVMPPLILGLTALWGHGLGWAVLALLLGWGSVATVLCEHPAIFRRRNPGKYVRRNIGGSRLWVWRRYARTLDDLESLVQRHLGPAEPLFAVPTLATLFPMVGRRSAVYDTFCVYPASEADQQMMLRSIEEQRVRLALVHDFPLDGREELRFSRTHPAVWSHLASEFEPLHLPELPAGYHVMRLA
jgi:hypothetical protein